ncbi:Lrp/AsnC family transcriptional regulator [Methylomonas sp. BW4-1]|uniref:Lrp/AsnC family transcriptional regulator n=1 Tax=Methylomonas sp. BW4-1 TaxID=3376685 RepID=UPI0040416D06
MTPLNIAPSDAVRLQADGRISKQELADRIGLSASPCLRRVRAVEEGGLIVGYRALLDAKALGLTLMALSHIPIDRHTPECFNTFEAAVAGIPGATAVHSSFLLRRVVDKTAFPVGVGP